MTLGRAPLAPVCPRPCSTEPAEWTAFSDPLQPGQQSPAAARSVELTSTGTRHGHGTVVSAFEPPAVSVTGYCRRDWRQVSGSTSPSRCGWISRASVGSQAGPSVGTLGGQANRQSRTSIPGTTPRHRRHMPEGRFQPPAPPRWETVSGDERHSADPAKTVSIPALVGARLDAHRDRPTTPNPVRVERRNDVTRPSTSPNPRAVTQARAARAGLSGRSRRRPPRPREHDRGGSLQPRRTP